MRLIYEEQKKRKTNKLDENIMPLMPFFLYEKANNHEERITGFESELKKLIQNNTITNDNQFLPNHKKAVLDDYVNYKIEDKRVEQRLERIVSELKDVDDKKLQIQIVGDLVDEIKRMLKEILKQKNNYRRQMLLMFHEALKQHYVKTLFNRAQIKALIEVARVCNESFVTREQYFKMDALLCACGLDMIPDLE